MKTFAILAIALTSSAPAQRPSPFDRWDSDNDGKLSKQELPKAAQRNFHRIDADSNGRVSADELKSFFERRQSPAPSRKDITVQSDLPYAGTDNPRQHLDLILPSERVSEKPLPVIVFIHGGAWRAGDKRSGLNRLAPLVAGGDFAGVSVGYRLSDEAQWPAQIHDCKAAIRWIRAHAQQHGLDPEKIGIWGSSAGGHLVAMLGVSGGVTDLEGKLGEHLDQDSRVTCVVNFFGPSELFTMGDHPSSMDHNAPDSPESKLIGGTLQENKKKARSASPATFVSADDTPILNVHGTADRLVPYQQSVVFNQRLAAAGVSSKLITIEGGGHGNFGKANAEVNRLVSEFFAHHLRGAAVEIRDRKLDSSKAPVPEKSDRP